MTPAQRQQLVIAAAVVVVVVAQVVVVARLPLAGQVPSLVLAVVVAVGLTRGEGAGAAAGFTAGILLDLLPPQEGTLGVSALALLVVGALAGRITDPRGLAPVQLAGVTAALAALSWLVTQALAWLFGDPAAPPLWLPGFVAGTTAVCLVVVPAASWLIRRAGPNRPSSPSGRRGVPAR